VVLQQEPDNVTALRGDCAECGWVIGQGVGTLRSSFGKVIARSETTECSFAAQAQGTHGRSLERLHLRLTGQFKCLDLGSGLQGLVRLLLVQQQLRSACKDALKAARLQSGRGSNIDNFGCRLILGQVYAVQKRLQGGRSQFTARSAKANPKIFADFRRRRSLAPEEQIKQMK